MEPLNSKDRTVALVKFLALAFLVLALAIFVAYFDNNIDSRQIDILKAENTALKAKTKQAKEAITQLDTINSQLQRFDTEPNKQFAKDLIQRNITTLYTTYANDSSDFGKVLKRTSLVYDIDMIDKSKISMGAASSADKAEMEKKIAELKADLKDAQTNLIQCQMTLKMNK